MGHDRVIRVFEGTNAAIVREMLGFFVLPHTRTEFLAHLRQRAGVVPDQQPSSGVEDLLALLAEIRVLVESSAPAPPQTLAGVRLVLGIAGAIAAMDAPGLVRLLQDRGCDLRIAMTPTARRFVSVEALEALTHGKVFQGFEDRAAGCPVPHINLAEWAGVMVIYPATATTLSRIAAGDCSELVAAVALITAAPVLLAPSMNPRMYSAPAVRRNLERLRADGFALVEPVLGQEVAERPGQRLPCLGAAPPPRAVLELIELVLRAPGNEDLPRP